MTNVAHNESHPLFPAETISTTFEPASTVLSASARLAVLDALPVAVFLIDDHANIRFANQRTAELIGLDQTETLGRNVLDFVMVDDLDFAAELLNSGSGYAGETMGPSRVRFIDADGLPHWTQVWAGTAPPEFGIDGFIVTLTGESVRDVLASAVTSVAMDDELDRMLAPVALSARAMPICGRGVILVVQPATGDDDDRFKAVGTWPLDDSAINASGTPWHQALSNDADADIDDVAVARLGPAARDQLLSAGVNAMFVRVIRNLAGAVVGVFVVFREHTGTASANQVDHLNDAVQLASLAFAQANRRLELETVAHRDALTGVPNRAAFMERLRVEQRHLDVLFIDLDHFKSVNDTFGHLVGDAVLADAADRVVSMIRHDDIVYRTGGDEFVVVMEPVSKDERVALAERIVGRLTAPFDSAEQRVYIGATIGIASGADQDLADTVRSADTALYIAKERGRSCWAQSSGVA